MKIQVGNILDQMSPEVRKEAEKEAHSRGTTLEKFVENQLTAQLTEQDLDLKAAKVRFDRWDAGITADKSGGVRGGIRLRGSF